ncbi:CAP domain-containing protein [Nocardia sp. NPDC052316]|uniref:CAP domain-containing protein n=1 Tax=Nocardia sp. NPDC052316 TaxID=3364329 RepID=UPI0037CB8B61
MLSFSTAVGFSAFAFCAVAGAPAAQAAPESQAPADAVVSLTNNERAKAGCPALKVESRLTRAAQGHSEDMAAGGFMDHNSSKGDPGDRIRATGYRAQTWAENIAAGQRSASEVVNAWMNSAGHRANILNCGLRDIGVGYAKSGNGTPYWTQNFGTSNGSPDEKPAGGDKPGKPGGDKPGGDKPGGDKPGGGDTPGGDKPDTPSDGDGNPPCDQWNPWGDGSDNGDDSSWDPWGDGSDNGSDNGDNSPWDPWGDGSETTPDSGEASWNPWGDSSWDPWADANAGESSWDPWSNGFDKPANNAAWDPWSNGFDEIFGKLVGKGAW